MAAIPAEELAKRDKELPVEVGKAIQAIYETAGRIQKAYPAGKVAVAAFLPLQVRASMLMANAPDEPTKQWVDSAAALLADSTETMQRWYAYLDSQHKKKVGTLLPPLDSDAMANIVGVAPVVIAAAAALARVGAVLRSAWPWVVGGVSKLGKWIVKNPFKAAAATAAAGAVVPTYQAGKALGQAGKAAAGGIRTLAQAAGGLGGVVIVVVVAMVLMSKSGNGN